MRGGRRARRYPEPVTPEQLSDAVVTAVRGLHDDGALSLPGGPPETVTIERPRQLGHGDYATNVALQLAKQAGLAPRELAELVAERLRGAEGVAAVEVAGPGFLNITVEAGAQGRVAADDRCGRAGVRRLRPAGRKQQHQPRVRLGQPHRPAHPCQRPLGRGRRRAGRLLEASGARCHPRVLLQRPRRPDRPVQPLAAGERAQPADARRRLCRRSTSHEIADRPCAAAPRRAGTCPTTRRRKSSAISASRIMFEEIKRDPRDFGSTSTSASTSSPARVRGRRPRHRPAHASWATSTRRTARSGCAPSSIGDDKDRVVVKSDGHRRTSPATPPTTSTSGSAASTAVWSCSAPTTTGTSAG